jgi:DNA-binding MarR family transcriptional regulator
VAKLGPIRPADLAAEMRISPSTLTRNVKPLVDAGLVEVLPGADARSRLVSVTPLGRDKRQEAQRRWRVAQEGINEILGARRVVQLHALLDECLGLLSEE